MSLKVYRPLAYRKSLPYRDLPATETCLGYSRAVNVLQNSLPYRDLPTTKTWAISQVLVYHGTG